MSKTYFFRKTQQLPVSLDVAWQFFSNPENLSKITPEYMSFKIISKRLHDYTYPGQIIEYRVKPFMGINTYWMTEITHIEDQKFFVDEQRIGPYAMWHHEHHFKETGTGVEMTDLVYYRIPFGIFGDLANSVFVRNRLEKIFEYRYKRIEELFNKNKP